MCDLCSAGPGPPGLHKPADLCCAGPRTQGLPHQRYKHARSLFHWARPSWPVKLGIHRHTASPLCQPAPFRHTRTTLQKPAISPQLKASTRRPLGPNPPATCHRKAPNLPKKHTQTVLVAKEHENN
jgi:hypothetical protein